MQPTGLPISSGLIIPEARWADPVRHALDVIDSIHGDGELIPVPVKQTRSSTAHGFYTWDEGTGNPLEFLVNVATSTPAFTTVHEVAHLLDQQVLGNGGTFGTHLGRASLVLERMAASSAVRDLAALRKRRQALIEVRPGRRHQIRVNRKLVEDLVLPHEQFARGYAQYIAVRSGDETLLRQLSVRRSGLERAVYHAQWEDDDFAPIAAAFEGLLKELKWSE